jgi:5'(3')-deoxyribonucleotidase
MKYQICCDMDGVLCDFTQSAVDIINDNIQNKDEFKDTDPELYNLIVKSEKEVGGFITCEHIGFNSPHRNIRVLMNRLVTHNEDFWANLDWIEGGQEIWDKIKDHNPYILSAPMKNSEESMEGKRQWVQKNLKPLPKKIILDDDKGKYTKFGDKTGLLIDDRIDNIEDYRDNGGEAIWTTAWQRPAIILDILLQKS